MIVYLGDEEYEAGWTTDSTREPVVENILGALSIRARAVQLEEITDVIPT